MGGKNRGGGGEGKGSNMREMSGQVRKGLHRDVQDKSDPGGEERSQSKRR